MSVAHHRLSRPVYESLPWVYLTAGLLALLISYLETSQALSVGLGLPGILAVLAGVVVLLRRRGYRRLRAQYGAPDALDEATGVRPIVHLDGQSSAPRSL
jgi:hypothetical protein